jgi:hypothetical protein
MSADQVGPSLQGAHADKGLTLRMAEAAYEAHRPLSILWLDSKRALFRVTEGPLVSLVASRPQYKLG